MDEIKTALCNRADIRPSDAQRVLDAGYRHVPPGYLIVPGPESGEAWERAVMWACDAMQETENDLPFTSFRQLADAALRAALNIGETP